jgi:Bacterial Ig-like domain/Domain of unknown function (DUF4347)
VDSIGLYSCEVGADAGFVGRLGELTGAKVAAATGKVGAEALGGSWELQVKEGQSDAQYFQPQIISLYSQTLTINTVTSTAFTDGYVNTTEAAGTISIVVNASNRTAASDGTQFLLEIFSGATLIYSAVASAGTSSTAAANTTLSIANLASILGDDIGTFQGGLTFTVKQGAGGAVGVNTWNPLTNTAANSRTFTPSTNSATSFSVLPLPVLDTIAPTEIPTIVGFGSDGGTLGDNITNDTTITLTGNANVGSKIQVFDGTTLLNTVAVVTDANGDWTYTTSARTAGIHPFTARVVDDAGNSSVTYASDPLSITIDTTAPTVTSILRHTGTAATTNADTAQFLVTFSDPVINVNTTDFSARLGGSASGLSITNVAPLNGTSTTQYVVKVGGASLVNANNTLDFRCCW